jgi:Ser/Thr protein kinase RdoA (MazF antagonist)
VHFSGPRTTFFDFDDCFDGPLVADLVPQIAWLWNATRSEFPALVRILLDAYTSLSSLAETDFAAIPVLVQLHEICSIAFLAKYCSLDPVTWSQCLERSIRTLEDWSPGGAANAHFAPLAGTARMARTRVA